MIWVAPAGTYDEAGVRKIGQKMYQGRTISCSSSGRPRDFLDLPEGRGGCQAVEGPDMASIGELGWEGPDISRRLKDGAEGVSSVG